MNLHHSAASSAPQSTPIALVRTRLEERGCNPHGNGKIEARCPAHDDRRASLSVSEASDGKVLLHCHVGCTAEAITQALGLKLANLFPAKPEKATEKARIVATYDYKNENGELLFQVVRFEPKDFRQRRPDGTGGWTWNLDDCRRVLYRLPEVIGAVEARSVVYVVEGEKDVETAINKLGLMATCNSGGAGKWKAEYSEVLRGADVVILSDADEPGRRHALDVARSLHGVAGRVRVSGLPGAKDLSEWVAKGGTREKLEEIIALTATWDPPKNATNQEPIVRVFHRTDAGNGERLIARHGADLRHCHPWGKWLVWDGIRWAPDSSGEVRRRAKETVQSIYAEAAGCEEEADRKSWAKFAMQCEARAKIDSMIHEARDAVPVLPDDFDADPWLLNVQNGTLDLHTGELRQHRREDMLTKIAPVEYDQGAEAPLWAAFLARVIPDPDVRLFVQKAVGYSLTGDVSAQVFFFLHGKGDNGKSKFLEAVQGVLGDYARHVPSDLLLMKAGDAETERKAVALIGARFVSTIETEDGKRFAEAFVKQLTGGDRLPARRLYEEQFDFAPTHKVWLAANHKPPIRGTDHAMWRRVRLIPFEITIPAEDRDEQLGEKLRLELPGILAWAVEGCLAWQQEGLKAPEAVRAATDAYRQEMDILADFMAEKILADPEAEIAVGDLYAAYLAWCEEAKERPIPKRSFGDRVRGRGFEQDRRKAKRLWLGLRLRTLNDVGDAEAAGDASDPVFGKVSSELSRRGGLPEFVSPTSSTSPEQPIEYEDEIPF